MKKTQLFLLALLWVSILIPCTGFAEITLPKGLITLDGRAAPPLKLNDIDGEPFDIASVKGRWVFVHFWASWCGPCRREIPTINDIVHKFDNSQLEIVVINTSEDEDTVFNFLGIAAPDLNTLMDLDGAITERWQPRGLPATFFVDQRGNYDTLL